jgi:primase-polymerase (primpol)-like protein
MILMNTLKEHKIWVNWSYDTDCDGETVTIPYSPNTGHEAITNDSSTWGSYDMALNNYLNGDFEGIGFAFANGLENGKLNICGISFDKRFLHRKQANSIINLMQSYTERSHDGNHYVVILAVDPTRMPKHYESQLRIAGLHNVVKCSMSGNSNGFHFLNVNKSIDRAGAPLACWSYGVYDRTDAFKRFVRKYTRNEYTIIPMNTLKRIHMLTPDSTNDEIIQLGKELRGNLFTELYENGNTSLHANENGADMSLCHIFAAICHHWDNAEERIDELFRTSQLYRNRDKWDSDKKHRDRTIYKALHPYGIRRSTQLILPFSQ